MAEKKDQKTEKQKSQERMTALSTNIFAGITKTVNETEGDFTFAEINEVLIRIQHSYNNKALTNQYIHHDGAEPVQLKKS